MKQHVELRQPPAAPVGQPVPTVTGRPVSLFVQPYPLIPFVVHSGCLCFARPSSSLAMHSPNNSESVVCPALLLQLLHGHVRDRRREAVGPAQAQKLQVTGALRGELLGWLARVLVGQLLGWHVRVLIGQLLGRLVRVLAGHAADWVVYAALAFVGLADPSLIHSGGLPCAFTCPLQAAAWAVHQHHRPAVHLARIRSPVPLQGTPTAAVAFDHSGLYLGVGGAGACTWLSQRLLHRASPAAMLPPLPSAVLRAGSRSGHTL